MKINYLINSKKLALSSVLAMALATSACGDNSSEETESIQPNSSEQQSLQQSENSEAMSATTDDKKNIQDNVPIGSPDYQVAMVTSFEPYSFRGEDNEIVGFNVDIIDAIAKNQGFHVHYVQKPWDSKFGTIVSGSDDFIGSIVTITPERQELVDFTDGYINTKLSALMKIDAPEMSFDEIIHDRSFKYSVMKDGVPQKFAQSAGVPNSHLIATNTEFLGVRNVLNGNSEVMIAGHNILLYFANKYEGLKIIDNKQAPLEFGFVVQKGNTELLNKLNTGLASIKQNGQYDEIYRNWFGG